MKKLFVVLWALCTLVFCAVSASAATVISSGTCGTNVTWSLDSDYKLTISGTGNMNDYWFSSASQYSSYSNYTHPWYKYFNKIKTVEIVSGVTRIGNCAFRNCKGLTSVTIPDGVTSIGSYAFEGCSINTLYLDSLDQWYEQIGNILPNTQYLYVDGELLTDVYISDTENRITTNTFKNVKCISAFHVGENNPYYSADENGILYNKDKTKVIALPYGAKSFVISDGFDFDLLKEMSYLEEVYISADVEEIPDGAFKNCVSLKKITVDEENENYKSVDNVLYSSTMKRLYCYPAGKEDAVFTVPEKVTRFSPYAFYNNSSLTAIEIPSSVTILDEYLFYGCKALREITLPSSLKSIGNYAFAECPVLEKINWNASQITSLSSSAYLFKNSGTEGEGITIEFGSGITAVPSNLFYYNYANLVDVIVSDTVSSFGSYAFYDCSSIKNVYITNINKWLTAYFNNSSSNPLYYAEKLYVNGEFYENLTVESDASVTIPQYAFYDFDGFKSIDIKANGVNIGESAFYSCDSLRKIELTGGNVTLNKNAFYRCPSLENVTIEGSTISVGTYAFYNCPVLETVNMVGKTINVNSYAFSECDSLKNFIQSDASGSIGSYAFYSCDALTDVRLGNGITSIGTQAFKDCITLPSIIIPVSVSSIGSEAFAGCKKLKEIYILNANCLAADSPENTIYKNTVIYSHAGFSVEEYADMFGFDFEPIHISENGVYPFADCTSGNESLLKCRYCEEQFASDSISKLYHDYRAVLTFPTCTEDGYTTYTCQHCASSYTADIVKALGHEEIVHAKQEPTCMEIGWNEYVTCSRCDYSTYIELPATGHTPAEAVEENKVAATCTENGKYDSVVYCAICETEISRETKTLEKLGHTPAEAVKENEVPATCTADGKYDSVVYCSVCKAELSRETKTLNKLGHDYKAVVTAPTCTADGYTTYTCSRCKDSYTSDTVKATGHKSVTDKAVAATCTTAGKTEGSHCSVCGTVLAAQKTVSATGHKSVSDKAVPATCTASGKTEGSHCSVCGTVLTAQTIVPATGHKWDAGKVTLEPTYEKDGVKTFTCSVCKQTKTESIPKLEKTYTPGDVDNDGKITAADARLALRRSVGLENYKEGSDEFLACDVDNDKKVTAADARLILRASVGLEDPKTWKKE